ERRGQHRMPGPQPFPQHLDRAAVVVRGDLVPLDRAGFPGRGARMPERHRGYRPDPVQLGILPRDRAHRDAGRKRRCRRYRRCRGQHHQRVRLHLQARFRRGHRHLRRGLLDPLEGFRDDQLPLPGADDADVGGGDLRLTAWPGPGVVRPAWPGGNEEHEWPVLVGPGPAPWDGVAERVNPLNDLVSSHSSTYLTVPGAPDQPCFPARGYPRRGNPGARTWAPGLRCRHMTEAELPPRLTRSTFHGPLSEARAARIVARLTGTGPRTVLDIGCGWGELMLRILAAAPGATGLGLDTDEGDLARGRDSARARGL